MDSNLQPQNEYFAKKEEKESKSSAVDPEIKKLQSKLSTHFGSKIAIKTSGGDKGEIKIPYTSTEDLNRILEILDI